MKLVSVITVNFNQQIVTEELLNSIYKKNTYTPLEIIVVDNGSVDNPLPKWQQKFPGVQFIRSEVNLGFAGGNNLAIKKAKGEYLFLVNNDTEFEENLIEFLADSLEQNPDAGIVSPKIHYFGNSHIIQYAGYTKINYFTARNRCIGQYEMDKGQYDNFIGETAYIHGAAMMIRKEAIDKAGMMAENFFLYYEEYDWCEKMKRAGYKIYLNTNALIYHKESVSVGERSALKEYFMNRNRILFTRRNTNVFTTFIFCCYFLFIVVPRNIIQYIAEGQYDFIPILLKATWWNVTHGVNSKELGYPVNNKK